MDHGRGTGQRTWRTRRSKVPNPNLRALRFLCVSPRNVRPPSPPGVKSQIPNPKSGPALPPLRVLRGLLFKPSARPRQRMHELARTCNVFWRRAFVRTTCRCTKYNRLQRLCFPGELRDSNGRGQDQQDGHERGSDPVHPVHPVESQPRGTKRNNVEHFGRERSFEPRIFRGFRNDPEMSVPTARVRHQRSRPT
jgi:hypothetical protein